MNFLSQKHLRNDLLLVLCILIVALVFGFCFYAFHEKGNQVRVTVNGQLYGVYSLEQDQSQTIINGEYQNVLVIQQGKAYVKSANCPDGICVNHAPVEKNGESIICLPHGLVIMVETAETQPSADVVV